jgi:hypothetical protein
MMQPELIRVFDSQGYDYKQAFQVFLNHTDQKRNAKRVLQTLVDGLPVRKVFIDAGLGLGEVTDAFAEAFDRTIAIEPNAYLLTQLQRTIPKAETIGSSILSANPEPQGDFILCSLPSTTFQLKNGSRILNDSFLGCRPRVSPSLCSRIAAPPA